MLSREKFFDVSADLVNPVFQGIYEGEKYHDPDLEYVLNRAWDSNVKTILVTGKSVAHSQRAIDLANTQNHIFCSVGCSPRNCEELNTLGKLNMFNKMNKMIKNNPRKVVAVGECGLDFGNPSKCDELTQIKCFKLQVELSKLHKLPLLIRCQNAYDDLIQILSREYDYDQAGVILGFDGTDDQARRLQKFDYHIGISACSMKRKEQREVLYNIPLQRLVFMTDSPGCMVDRDDYGASMFLRTTFSSEVKEMRCPNRRVQGRNEPANIIQVLEVAAAVMNQSIDNIVYLSNKSCIDLFFSKYKSYKINK